MKTICITALLIISIVPASSTYGMAQTDKQKFTINLGLSDEGYGFPNEPQRMATNILPTVNLYGEYYFNRIISIGLYGAYTYSYFSFDSYYPSTSNKDAWKGWDAGLRYTIHVIPIFSKNQKLDLYLSAFSGYTERKLVYDKQNIYRNDLNYTTEAFSLGGLLGSRYFISKKIGVYGEAGLSRKFFLGVGVTYQISGRKE